MPGVVPAAGAWNGLYSSLRVMMACVAASNSGPGVRTLGDVASKALRSVTQPEKWLKAASSWR